MAAEEEAEQDRIAAEKKAEAPQKRGKERWIAVTKRLLMARQFIKRAQFLSTFIDELSEDDTADANFDMPDDDLLTDSETVSLTGMPTQPSFGTNAGSATEALLAEEARRAKEDQELAEEEMRIQAQLIAERAAKRMDSIGGDTGDATLSRRGSVMSTSGSGRRGSTHPQVSLDPAHIPTMAARPRTATEFLRNMFQTAPGGRAAVLGVPAPRFPSAELDPKAKFVNTAKRLAMASHFVERASTLANFKVDELPDDDVDDFGLDDDDIPDLPDDMNGT
eukprot:TRINITY_DN9808_c0_g2_i1.p1 TRINITY_DN9808_c0_g2~~TRINITY_DN9808_c0_g2_i1.p1  ORF type:complete len:299 (+),score=98.35 TRINITY_DN9808_c0_g2_i1:64-897(+)